MNQKSYQALHHPGIITSDGKKAFQMLAIDPDTRDLKPVRIPTGTYVCLDPNALDAFPLLAMVTYCREKGEEFKAWCVINGFPFRE